MSRSTPWLLGLLAALASGALLAGLGRTDLWPPDETRVAEISREMAAGAGWVVPTLNGRDFIDEPPLFYWAQAGVYRLAGAPSSAAARLPAALGALIGVAVTAWLARRLGASAGIAALVLATAPEYWWMARSGTPDTATAAATTVALACFFVAWRRGRTAPLVAASIALATAFWLKSLLGVGLAGFTIAAFMLIAGRGRLSGRAFAGAAILAAILGAAWLAAVARAVGVGAVWYFLVTNHLGRLSGVALEGHVHGPLYYLSNLALDLFPWVVVLPLGALAAFRRRRDPDRLYPLCWAVGMLLVLSVSASKRAHYLLPAYPAFAILIAQCWQPGEDGAFGRLTRRLLAVLLLVPGPVLLVVLSLDPAVTMAPAATRADRAHALAPIVLAGLGHAWPWIVAGIVTLLAMPVLVMPRARRPAVAATCAGASVLALHLVVVLAVLPAFDPFCSARRWGELLERAAAADARLVTFGIQNRQALSPFMFYAGHAIEEVPDAAGLAQVMDRGVLVCALIGADALATLPARLRDLPAIPGRIGELRFALVSGPAGGC